MNVIDAVNIVQQERVPHLLHDQMNPMEFYTDDEFYTFYRLRKDSFVLLCDIAAPDLENFLDKNYLLQPIQMLSLGLAYFASGTFLVLWLTNLAFIEQWQCVLPIK